MAHWIANMLHAEFQYGTCTPHAGLQSGYIHTGKLDHYYIRTRHPGQLEENIVLVNETPK